MKLKAVVLFLSAGLDLGCQAFSVSPAGASGEGTPDISLQVPPKSPVGSRRAGLLCLPDGHFKIEDFFPSSTFLKALILGAQAEHASSLGDDKSIAISLKNLKVSLCARDYLFGQGRYSGSVTADFEITSVDNQMRLETVHLTIEKDNAQTAAEIGQNLASELVKQMDAG